MVQNASKKMQKLAEQNGGTFPAWTDLGGYPLYYLDAGNNTLCATCASENDEFSEPIVAYDTYLEGATMHCDHCNAEIESAYGDPEEEETN
jgi:hypothetical protein